MIRLLSLLIGCGLLITGALVHGSATHRWNAFGVDEKRARAVHDYVWQNQDYSDEVVPSELPVKERSQVTCRRYTSESNLPTIVVSITSGPPGAVSTHTPDVCYPGSGYKTIREPKREKVTLPNGQEATYYVADYEKMNVTNAERQRIRWTWTTDGRWVIPERPRFEFLREPELFKIYLVNGLPTKDDNANPEDTPSMRQSLLSILQGYSDCLQK